MQRPRLHPVSPSAAARGAERDRGSEAWAAWSRRWDVTQSWDFVLWTGEEDCVDFLRWAES